MSALKPGQVQYLYRHAIGGFFEFPTENARKLIPSFMSPVEPHHGQSVLSVMAFDFSGSSVGEYGELVLSVPVAPRASSRANRCLAPRFPVPGRHHDASASREHAIELWHLPHFMDDIDIKFNVGEHEITVLGRARRQQDPRHAHHRLRVGAGGALLPGVRTRQVGHLHGHDGDERAVQRERGRARVNIEIYPHAFTKGLDPDGVNNTPFRELWMRDGKQTFDPLETIGPGGA